MILPRFDKPIQRKPYKHNARLHEVQSLLEQRYRQKEIAEMLGMAQSALSDFMIHHGLKVPK